MSAQPAPAIYTNARVALAEYLQVRETIIQLEAHEGECTCQDFDTCPLCHELHQKNDRLRYLMALWGDHWAVELGRKLKGND